MVVQVVIVTILNAQKNNSLCREKLKVINNGLNDIKLKMVKRKKFQKDTKHWIQKVTLSFTIGHIIVIKFTTIPDMLKKKAVIDLQGIRLKKDQMVNQVKRFHFRSSDLYLFGIFIILYEFGLLEV